MPQSQPDPSTRKITWANITLAAGKQQAFTVRARIAAETPSGLTIRTTAEITTPNTSSSAADTTSVDKQPFIIVEQAATTTAPALAPSPQPITPTAATGATSTLALVASTLAGSLGLLHLRRLA